MTFPVALAIFLKKVIGGKYVADRERIYRDFLRHRFQICWFQGQHPNRQKQGLSAQGEAYVEGLVETNLAHHRANGFDESTFKRDVRDVAEWLPGYRKKRLVERALVGGRARSAKISANKACIG